MRGSQNGWAVVLAVLLFSVTPAAAQVTSLRVNVIDGETRLPLEGAGVVLRNSQKLIAPSTETSDTDGFAVFPVLRAGSGYVIEVSLSGYATRRIGDLKLTGADRETVVVQMTPALQETVRVTVERDLVDVDAVGNVSKFSDDFVEQLPIPGRFYQNILTLAPGVKDADGDGNPNVHGARTRDFRALVNGVSNVDPLTGQWMSFVNAESIEVMDVLTSGAGVEFGRAQGGFAQIVQKQGSNSFEGVFNFLYRSSELDGNGATNVQEETIPSFEWVQPSLLLSGPLVKDHLWFRLSHEYIKREDPQDLLGAVIPTTKTQDIIADQITWQVSPRNKLAFQYQYDPLTFENVDLASTVPLSSTRNLERGGPTYSLTWVAPFSTKLLADTTIAWQDHFQNVLPATTGVHQFCARFGGYNQFSILNESYCHASQSGLTSGSYFESTRDKRQRFTFHTKATWYTGRFLKASHRLKFGLVIENERYFRELERGTEVQDIAVRRVEAPPDAFCSRCPYQRTFFTLRAAVPRDSDGRATSNSWAFYLEDQIKPANNLALTIGLRLDKEEIDSTGTQPFDPVAEEAEFLELARANVLVPTAFRRAFTAYPDVEGFQANLAEVLDVNQSQIRIHAIAAQSAFWPKKQRLDDISLSDTRLSPRISLAWDPSHNGDTKIAFSAGRYYDKVFLAVPLAELEPLSTNLQFESRTSIGTGSASSSVSGLPDAFSPTISTQLVDRNLSTPYQDEFALSFERRLWPETSLKLTWLRREFRDQLQDVDINHTTGDRGRCVKNFIVGDISVLPAPGEGTTLVDPYTGEVYEDTDPGPGDGIIDDCTGDVAIEIVEQAYYDRIEADSEPDGLADLYVLNPGWGELLLIGNFNSSEYEAYILEVVRRFYRNWEMQASYTWSKAEGDAEDFGQVLGNERNLADTEYGFLSYDQRHTLQINAITLTPWGFRAGARLRWESGLPFSILESKLTVLAAPPEYLNVARDRDALFRLRYPTGQRNDQRNPSFWTVDLRVVKELQLSRQMQLQLTGEIFNVLNDNTIRLQRRLDGVNTGVGRFGRRYQVGLRLGF